MMHLEKEKATSQHSLDRISKFLRESMPEGKGGRRGQDCFPVSADFYLDLASACTLSAGEKKILFATGSLEREGDVGDRVAQLTLVSLWGVA